MPSKKTSQPSDPVYEDINIPVPVVTINEPGSPKHEPLPPAVVHPIGANSEYEHSPKPSVSNHVVVEVTGSINADEATDPDESAGQEPMYMVVKKPSLRAATAATQVVEVASSHTSEQPTEAIGYQIESISDSEEKVSTPPRTEEMGVLVENTNSGSYDDAVYEVVD